MAKKTIAKKKEVNKVKSEVKREYIDDDHIVITYDDKSTETIVI